MRYTVSEFMGAYSGPWYGLHDTQAPNAKAYPKSVCSPAYPTREMAQRKADAANRGD